MELITYQALLSHPENINRVRAARGRVVRIGGDVRIDPPNQLGMVLVMLWLPRSYSPEEVLPDIPFYPV